MKEKVPVYITGARGFVGKHLTSKLDEFDSIPHEWIANFPIKPYERFFFLSAYGNMAFHEEDDRIIKANIEDLITVLRQSDFKDGIRSFIFMSSSSVKREVQTMYSRTKNAAEQILLAYMDKYNAPICIVRPFSITGVGEQKEHLIPTLIRSCFEGEKMPFVPDSVHDYIDVDDVVSGLITLSKHQVKGVYELGTGKGVTNNEVKDLVEEATGEKANVEIVKNLRPYDSQDWVSTNQSMKKWGWWPNKTLKLSIQEMVEDYERTRKTDN